MSEKSEGERLAIVETEMKSMKELFEKIDKRLSATERSVWIGVGIVIAIQFLLKNL